MMSGAMVASVPRGSRACAMRGIARHSIVRLFQPDMPRVARRVLRCSGRHRVAFLDETHGCAVPTCEESTTDPSETLHGIEHGSPQRLRFTTVTRQRLQYRC